ncbi:MAG TPA: phage terminase large subunit [Alphaproteobacteria bacterium]|jgi:hypothetical protein
MSETDSQPAAAAAEKPRRSRGFAGFVQAWCKTQGLKMPELHEKMARWLGKHWRAKRQPKRLLLLAFRGAGKSTLVGLFAAWLLARRPDLRILALSADLALARKMVRTVKRLIETHPEIKGLKPKIPELWGGEQFTVERAATLRDPSMLARGIDGNFTGSRADIVICDDVEVPGNSDTAAKRTGLRERLGEIEFVLVPGGTQLYLGTPHSYYSIYAAEPRPDAGETRPFLDGFVRKLFPIVTAEGESQWPKRFALEAIDALKRTSGPAKFASQMMLTPAAPEQCRFDPAKLLRYDSEVEYREAQGRGSLWLEGRKLSSIRVWWDPAFGRPEKSDRNAIALAYQDEAGGYWIHRVHYFGHDPARAAAHPETEAEADQLCRAAAAFAHEMGAPAITVEDNGIGKLLPGLLRKALATVDPSIAVLAHHAREPKDARILHALDVPLAGGLLHAHASVCDGPFAEELRGWRPEGKSGQADDGVDAVAGAIRAEPTRLGPYPRAPRTHGAWRSAAQAHRAETEFQP